MPLQGNTNNNVIIPITDSAQQEENVISQNICTISHKNIRNGMFYSTAAFLLGGLFTSSSIPTLGTLLFLGSCVSTSIGIIMIACNQKKMLLQTIDEITNENEINQSQEAMPPSYDDVTQNNENVQEETPPPSYEQAITQKSNENANLPFDFQKTWCKRNVYFYSTLYANISNFIFCVKLCIF